MILQSIEFNFSTHVVIWKPVKDIEIKGKMYKSGYSVTVCPGNHTFKTSFNANKTNSIDFIKKCSE